MTHDASAADASQLFAELYDQLHRMARREAYRAGPHSGMSATTVLHEAYLNISSRTAARFPSEAHFVAYAARAMRSVLIDRVRERHALKRGGGLHVTSLDTRHADECAQPELLPDISEALDELAKVEPALALVVDLKFFCGCSVPEIAELTKCSERTVQRQWDKARLLLLKALA